MNDLSISLCLNLASDISTPKDIADDSLIIPDLPILFTHSCEFEENLSVMLAFMLISS